MLAYPVTIFTATIPKQFRKGRASEYSQAAREIQDYLNKEMSKRDPDVREFPYADVAKSLKIDSEIVESILASIGGGHNGVTILRGNYDDAIKAKIERGKHATLKQPKIS